DQKQATLSDASRQEQEQRRRLEEELRTKTKAHRDMEAHEEAQQVELTAAVDRLGLKTDRP
ncbi:hypothetical protein KIPB_013975, partial [Kipferlia bialata]